MKALKAFSEPQRSVKMKISVHFFSSSEIETGRVKVIKVFLKKLSLPSIYNIVKN